MNKLHKKLKKTMYKVCKKLNRAEAKRDKYAKKAKYWRKVEIDLVEDLRAVE